MDELLTEQQQAEAVRNWLRTNGFWLAGGVLLGLAALFGWNQWQRWQDSRAEAASVLYEEVLNLTEAGRLDDATASLDRLTQDFDGTIYAAQGRLALARLQLDRNDPNAAAELLRAVAQGGGPDEVRHIARLRLARVLIFQEKPEEALAVLDGVAGEAFEPLANEVRGDAFVAQAKPEDAAREYRLALAAPVRSLNRELVQAKLDDLGIAGSTTEDATMEDAATEDATTEDATTEDMASSDAVPAQPAADAAAPPAGP